MVLALSQGKAAMAAQSEGETVALTPQGSYPAAKPDGHKRREGRVIIGSHYTLIDIGHLSCDTMSLEALDTAEPKTRDALAIGNVWLFFFRLLA